MISIPARILPVAIFSSSSVAPPPPSFGMPDPSTVVLASIVVVNAMGRPDPSTRHAETNSSAAVKQRRT